ncbi:hypothetical protein [Pseudomonas brassicacearum]|uniref:hypothetical protein n=1 Tax=Pseudomonas brassicacearum TaxID=930166 RepID=UPI001D007EBB|nr:hypothetical protein [Pseudomonas brassicacearum]
MDIQSSTLNELFDLYPVIILGWVTPVQPAGIAAGGIPKSLYDDQPRGLRCLIDPWTELQRRSWTMAVDDRADLYINDDPFPVDGKNVGPGEEQLRMELHVPHGRLLNGVNRLYYKVSRPSQNGETSRDLTVLYHLRAPGEPAPQGLNLVIPPDVITDGVSAERAAQGVEFGFTYSNRRNHDRINFLLGDVNVPFEVPAGSIPVTRTLFTETFLQAGNDPYTALQFRVTDQLGNSNQSETHYLDIHLDTVSKPIISAAAGANGPIENDGITTDTTVAFTGTAQPSGAMDFFRDQTPLGTITASPTGTWTYTATGLPIGLLSFTAVAKYGEGLTSNAWRFTVQSANVELRIDRVEDGNGNDIPQISSTPYRQVVVHGKGTPSTNVDLFEGATPVGTTRSDAAGVWRCVTSTPLRAGSIALTARYAGTGTSSNSWPLVVYQALNYQSTFAADYDNWAKGPAASDGRDLVRVNDPADGWLLQNMTYTNNSHGIILHRPFAVLAGADYEFAIRTRRIVTPTPATPSLNLETNTSQGEMFPPTPLTQNWTNLAGTLKATANAEVDFRIKNATASGDGNDYQIKTIWVWQRLRPSILTMIDSNGEHVPNGGTTTAGAAHFSGFALPGMSLVIFVDGQPAGVERVADSEGHWTTAPFTISGPGRKECRVQAQYLNGTMTSLSWIIHFV